MAWRPGRRLRSCGRLGWLPAVQEHSDGERRGAVLVLRERSLDLPPHLQHRDGGG